MLAACIYSGLFATAINNVLLARANRRLGPTVANLYMPLQPLTTVVVDFLTLNDAVYLAPMLCAVGVMAGLVLAVVGKQAADAPGGAGTVAAAAEAAVLAEEERAGLLDGGEDADGVQLTARA